MGRCSGAEDLVFSCAQETLKNTPLWKTLEIEELSDKDHMPINHYKNEEEKN